MCVFILSITYIVIRFSTSRLTPPTSSLTQRVEQGERLTKSEAVVPYEHGTQYGPYGAD